MRLTVNFLLKKARQKQNGEIPIYVRFTMNGKRVELATGVSTTMDKWDESGQQVKGRSEAAQIVNNRLDKIQLDILDTYNQLKSSGKDFDVITIKNILLNNNESIGVLNVFDYYLNSILAKLNKGYSMETYKHYKSSRKRLGEFIKSQYRRNDFPLGSIDYSFLDAFDVYLKNEFGVHQNTAWNYHKHLRRVLYLAVSMTALIKTHTINTK